MVQPHPQIEVRVLLVLHLDVQQHQGLLPLQQTHLQHQVDLSALPSRGTDLPRQRPAQAAHLVLQELGVDRPVDRAVDMGLEEGQEVRQEANKSLLPGQVQVVVNPVAQGDYLLLPACAPLLHRDVAG